MKQRILFLSITFLFFATCLTAQQTSYGIQAGTNYARFTPRFPAPNNEDISFSGKVGFYLGGYANIELSEKIRVQPSVIFASQGSNFKNEGLRLSNGTTADFESRIIESTIIIPIAVQNYISQKFYIEAGPQIGYIFDLKDKIIVNTVPGSTIGTFGNLSETNYDKFDFGLFVGLGYKLSDNFGLNSRYYFGVIERGSALKSSILNIGIEYSF